MIQWSWLYRIWCRDIPKTPKYKKGILLYGVKKYSYDNDARHNRFCNSAVTKGRSKAVHCFIYATLQKCLMELNYGFEFFKLDSR